MKNNRRAVPGITIIAVLLVGILLMNVLLRNENDTLPLEKGTKVTILGAMSYNYIAGGRNMDTTEDYYGHTGTGELATFTGSEYADNKDNCGDTGRQTGRTMVITLQ